MRKKVLFIAPVILMLLSFTPDKSYKDGVYCGKSRADYTREPYYGCAKITIENGKIVKVDFSVRDSAKQVDFDDQYEKYFTGNPQYIQQCRNDRKGVKTYPARLLKKQDVDQVDAISGATWSCNLFKASVKEALSSAK